MLFTLCLSDQAVHLYMDKTKAVTYSMPKDALEMKE